MRQAERPAECGKAESSSEEEEEEEEDKQADVSHHSSSAVLSPIIYPPTVIVLFGSSWSECGYCQGKRADLVDRPASESSRTYTVLVSHATLSPRWYQDLINRGWRRSGPAIYKPDNKVSCCPLVTIRLPVQKFEPTKSQRKLLRKASNLSNNKEYPLLPNCSQQQRKHIQSLGKPDKKKQKQQPPSVPGELSVPMKEEGKANATHVLASEQKLIEESGVLETLSTRTREILTSLLSGSTETSGVIPSTIVFKLSKPAFKKGNRKLGWTAVTTICAAIAGPSQGKIQREKLSADLAHALRTGGGILWNTSSSPCLTVSISKVEAHEGSGQVTAYVCISEQQLQQLHFASTLPISSESSNKNQDANADDSRSTQEDALTKWWKSEFSSEDGTPPPPLVDRTITIETVNAFDSCLDPAVHQLYAAYQRVVHNDSDPFSDDLQKFFQSEEVQANNSGGGTVDDPWASFASRHAPSLPQKEGDERPGGQWLLDLQRMMYREYHHLPLRRQARLAHFVAHFCEFYVASQFSTTKQQLTVTKETTATGNKSSLREIPCGTYHQQYRINGRLIAVGVLDFLPEGLSSVYLFYSPSFSHNIVALGKYCALKEIEYCRDTLRLPYYFLGYYLHSNKKMRYKADYAPSELLCSKHNVWVPAKEAIPKIVANGPRHYCDSLSATEIREKEARSTRSSKEEEKEDTMVGIVENMQLQVNGNHRFKLSDLSADDQAYLRPLLLPFCQETGPKACLDCIVDLG